MRVLAVTADASLLVSLHSVLRGWEVSIVREPEEAVSAAPGAAIVIVDYGSTELGLEIAERLSNMGVTVPCLIVGDRGAPSADARILVRPFGIDDLVGAVLELAGTPAAAPPPPEPARAGEARVAERPSRSAPRAGNARPARAPSQPPESDGRGSRSSPTARRPAAPRRDQRDGRRDDRRPASPPEPAKPVKPAAPRKAVAQKAVNEKPPAAKPAVHQPAAEGDAPAKRPAAATQPPLRTAPAWPAASVTPPPAVTGKGARNVLAPARPSRPARAGAADRARSLFRRSAGGPSPDAFGQRLRSALAGIQEIEALLAEVPPLGRSRALATALLADLAARFEPELAVVYTRGADGSYQVLSSHGLTAIEELMRVDASQPLFGQVAGEREAILIAPVEFAGPLVAGITIARTEALAAVPFVVDKACYGILVVGRGLLGEADLDQLAALAQEAAPGLAFAQALEKLALR